MTDTNTPADGQGGQAATTTTQGTPSQAPPAGSEQPFYSSFANPDLKTWTEAKGFKSAEAQAESLWNMEKLMGAPKERLVKIPEKADDPEWKGIWNKLGVPAEASSYELPVPEGMPTDFADEAKKWMHEENIPAGAAKNLANKWNAKVAQMAEAHEKALELQSDTEMGQLKAEWGIQAAEKENIARAAAKEFFNLDGDKMNAVERTMGSRAFMEAMVAIGEKLGEAKFVQGNGSDPQVSTIAQAQQRIRELQKDREFAAALMDKKHIKHVQSMQEWDALNRKAAGL